jgi:hypothetical protein
VAPRGYGLIDEAERDVNRSACAILEETRLFMRLNAELTAVGVGRDDIDLFG